MKYYNSLETKEYFKNNITSYKIFKFEETEVRPVVSLMYYVTEICESRFYRQGNKINFPIMIRKNLFIITFPKIL